MKIPKLDFITHTDLRHALAIAVYFTERAPEGDVQEEFAHLTLLFHEFVASAALYEELDDEERLRLAGGASGTRGMA